MATKPTRALVSAGLLTVSLVLAGCMTPPLPNDMTSYTQIREGRVAIEQKQQLIDCLMDGFDQAHQLGNNLHARQQRRIDSVRVDVVSSGILVSASVFDDGRVTMVEMTGSFDLTRAEREAFDQCSSSLKLIMQNK